MKFICGSSFESARTTAEIDYGWARAGAASWHDSKGDRVRYLGSTYDLHGRRDGIVYIGFGFTLNRDLRDLHRVAHSNGFMVVEYAGRGNDPSC